MTDQQTDLTNASYLSIKVRHFRDKWQQFRLKSPILARIVAFGVGSGLLGILFIISLFLLVRIGAFGKLPSKDNLKAIENHAASEVFSADGQLLGKYFVENRTNLQYDEISPDLINALIATEDARFFEHSGIDGRAWVRVFIRTILMRDDSGGGGSTLSQQLAKNLFKRKRYRLLSIPINKIREMYIAKRLEKVYSKDELISLYLNTVPFGVNIFGVEVAAQQFFNTSAKEIKTENAAVIIGMLKANTYYNPVRNPKNAKRRRNVVLGQMEKYNYLDKVAIDSLQALPLVVDYKRESNNEGLATYFREHLRQELAEKVKAYQKEDGSPYNLYTDGLKIYTSVHAGMQQYAEEAVREHMSRLQKDFDAHWKNKKPWGKESVLKQEMKKSKRYQSLKKQGLDEEAIMAEFKKPVRMTVFNWKGDEIKEMSPLDSIKFYYTQLNAGFLVMDPSTGYIRAWVGGTDHQYFQYDHVKSKRQVGSTFKPIVYASAIKGGFQPCDYYYNRLVTYTDYDDWKPENSDNKYGGLYSMQGALSKSVNSVAVDLIIRNGVDSVRELAAQMGITSKIPDAPAIALGAADASLYDMVKVYGTLANRGRRPTPTYLIRIEDSQGKLIANFEEQSKNFQQVLSQDQADMMTQMMKGVVDSGTARRLRFMFGLPGDIAGKTGTTQSHADGWFMGFTPNLVAGAWVGGEYPSVRFRTIKLGQGANTALPIWGRFMKKVYADKQFSRWANARFAEPSYEVQDALNCMPFVEELPELVEIDINTGNDSFDEALEGLLDIFKNKKKEKDPKINQNPRQKKTRRKKQSEASRKQQAKNRKKREKQKRKNKRKKKRKEAWDKLFKKN